MADPIFQLCEPMERSRTYSFPNGQVTFKDVIGVAVSARGTHRLNTLDGKKHIVPPGWIAVTLDVDAWSF